MRRTRNCLYAMACARTYWVFITYLHGFFSIVLCQASCGAETTSVPGIIRSGADLQAALTIRLHMKALLLEGNRRRLLTLRFHPSKGGHPNDMEEQAWHRLGDAAPLQHVWQDIPLFPGTHAGQVDVAPVTWAQSDSLAEFVATATCADSMPLTAHSAG